MPDLRLIDEDGLHQVARLLAVAAVDIRAGGRELLPIGQSSGLVLLEVAAELERSATDLRSRTGGAPPIVSTTLSPRRHLTPFRGDGGPFEGRRSRPGQGEHLPSRHAWEQWGGSAAVRSSEISGPFGTFSAAILAAESSASVWLVAEGLAAEAGFEAGAGADLMRIGHAFDTRIFESETELCVGAEVAAGGTVVFDAAAGEIELDAGLTAFVGVAAAAGFGLGPEEARVEAGGEVGIGAGVDLEAGFTVTDGVLDFDFGASAFLGLGAGFDLSVELDLGAIGEAAVDAVEAATGWIGSLWP